MTDPNRAIGQMRQGSAAAALILAAALSLAPAARAQTGASAELQEKCANENEAADPDAQIAACTALLRARPAFADAYGKRGVAYVAKGDLNQALADYNRALSLRLSPVDLMNRASLLMAKKDYTQAIADTDKAAALSPDDARIESSRCWKRAVAGLELDVARTACSRAMQMAPDDPNSYDSRGLVGLKQGKFAEAFADYDAALKLVAGKDDRNEASFLFGRGLAQLKLGKEAEGNADIEAAIARNKNISAIYALNGVTR